MAEFPALPLWTDAYLADCAHLSDAEHGRYLIMLMHMWRMPFCRFPNDDAWLARKFGRSEQDFVLNWKPLMHEFMQCSGNWWTQKRLSAEWAFVAQLSQKRRAAAKARWEKEKDPDTCNAPTPTPISKKVSKKEGARATRWHPDCAISSEWLGDAQVARLRHSLPEIDVRLEAEKFVNFWAAKSGAQAAKLDWHKTWINWILKAEAPRHGNRPSANDKFLSGVADAIRQTLGSADDGNGNVIVGPFGKPLLPP